LTESVIALLYLKCGFRCRKVSLRNASQAVLLSRNRFILDLQG
jgi:hypothetical protein